MTEIYGKDNSETREKIESAMSVENEIVVYSTYETFYGIAMGRWISELCDANGWNCECIGSGCFYDGESAWRISKI